MEYSTGGRECHFVSFINGLKNTQDLQTPKTRQFWVIVPIALSPSIAMDNESYDVSIFNRSNIESVGWWKRLRETVGPFLETRLE